MVLWPPWQDTHLPKGKLCVNTLHKDSGASTLVPHLEQPEWARTVLQSNGHAEHLPFLPVRQE